MCYWECYWAEGLCHTCSYQQGGTQLLSLLHVLVLSLQNPWLIFQNKYFLFSTRDGSGVQYWHWLTRSIFLLSQTMGQQIKNLLLHGSPVREKEAGPPKSAEIFVSLAPSIAGLHFIQCSLAPMSWLQEQREGMSLNGHSPAQSLQHRLQRAAAG